MEKKVMVKIVGLGLLSVIVLGVGNVETAQGQTNMLSWVKVREHDPKATDMWAPRDSAGEVVFDGKMWLIGGWPGSMRDVWHSSDGANWTMAVKTAPWIHCDLPATVVFKDKMWMMGGWAGGRDPSATSSNQVWSSSDGAKWDCVTSNAAWSARLAPGCVVFKDKIWILGGIQRYFDGEKSLLNDVWNSDNGADWKLVTAHAPWAPRAFHGALVFQDKIWVMGGGNYVPTYVGYNDVWNSSDGVNWTQVADHAQWSPRIWFSYVVYRNRMWVLGGWSNYPSRNWNDVWYSDDGANWKPLVTPMVWSPRHEMSAYVFNDKLWIVGGNFWPVQNDVWRIGIPESWFTGRP